MKKQILFFATTCMAGLSVYGQDASAIDAYRFSQPDLKGTARFMSMGGAFGALGGDLSTLSQNPAGIGVYRSNEIGFTLDLDFQNASSTSQGVKTGVNQTKFLLNNLGGVATLRLPSSTVPNLNLGFTYNKGASFNRRYQGVIPQLNISMSNYIAGTANNNGLTVADVESSDNFNAYNPNDGGLQAPWLTILGYDGYLINPNGDPDDPYWTGQWGEASTVDGVTNPATSGSGYFDVIEKGSVDEYNIAIGGNIANKVYWGMNFDIINFDYRLQSLWGENLENAWVYNESTGNVGQTTSQWNMQNLYRANGSGFNYQLGVIVKPIQELRLGLAFHTPTWYNLTQTYSADILGSYYGKDYNPMTNNGTPGYCDVNLRTPWKVIASAAAVIGSKLIVSADYEWQAYQHMKLSEPTYNDYYYDYYAIPGSPFNPDIYAETNQDIKDYYKQTNTLRVGAEYRVTPKFSVRAGYSFVSSPVTSKAKENQIPVYTVGTVTDYRFDNETNYITCGLGYRFSGFYVDLAYVYKHMTSEYHAFSPDPTSNIRTPQASVSLNNSQLVLSCGLKF